MNRFKVLHPEYEKIKMTYAGRLDPMASGLLIVLAGDMVHEKESLLNLAKTYECEAIIGIETDTYDVLGMPTTSPRGFAVDPLLEGEGKVKLLSFVKTFTQKYPPYSSKTIKGKQMHELARSGELNNDEIPSREVTVNSITNISYRKLKLNGLVKEIIERVKLVTGDFRQNEAIAAWEQLVEVYGDPEITLVSFTIDVSGGTYIRGIVHELGQSLGIGACIFSLHRTRVGEYFLP